jgi:carbon starvation protein
MAQIFTGIPGMRGLISYWYHFAIMFEALFILTTIDAGTRVSRFIVQEFAGRFHAPLGKPGNLLANIGASAVVVAGWSYFLLSGDISTIWPMFGIANQLLGCIALCVGTTVIINMGKTKYAWVTLVPVAFLATNTLLGGFLSVRDNYWPLTKNLDQTKVFQGYVDSVCTGVIMALVVFIIINSVGKWMKSFSHSAPLVEYSTGD